MAVRNFWINANIDGRETNLEGGPRAKEDGFTLVIKQRDNGNITIGARVNGYYDNGELVLEVVDAEGNVVLTNKTKR
jgi:hypothetical protein